MNMQRQSEEREIRLADLFWKIVYGWRFVLVCAVIFAILLAGFRYWRTGRAASAKKEQADISIEQMKDDLTDEEMDAISTAQALQSQIESQKKYRTESVWMNLNAYAVDEVVLQYYVDTDYVVNLNEDILSDYGQELVQAYTAYVENRGIQSVLKENLDWDIEESYIGELLSASTVSGANQFTIVVAGADAEHASELADLVERFVGEYQPILEKQIGSHKLTQLDRGTVVVKSDALADAQTALTDKIMALQTKLDTMTATFTAAQSQIYQGESEEETEPEVIAVPGISIRYLVLGGMMGIFIGCAWIALCFLLSNKVKTIQELQDYYGLCILGIWGEEPKKRLFSGIDHWIDRLCKKEVRKQEEQIEMILTKLQVRCKKDRIEKVLFAASFRLTETEQSWVEQTKKRLESSGIRLIFGGDIVHNAASFERMSEIGQIVLLEKAGVSTYAGIEQELNLCEEQKVNVLGVIGLGS